MEQPGAGRDRSVWRLLVIDDDEEDYWIVCEMLETAQAGFCEIAWAATYESGRAELAGSHYDAVLVDYHLGPRSGIDLIREANERAYPAPLILLTGQGSAEVDREALQAGASYYLVKEDITPALLERTLRYAIQSRQKEQAADRRPGRSWPAAAQFSSATREAGGAAQAQQDKPGRIHPIGRAKLFEQRIARYHALLESALAGLADAMLVTDARGRWIEFNQAFATFYRFPDRQACAAAFDRFPGLLEFSQPDGTRLPQELWPVPRALRGETEANAEYILRRQDSGEQWTGSFSFGPIRDQDGVISGAVVLARDVTEVKRIDAALHQLSRAVEQSPVTVVITDTTGKIEYVNPKFERLTGYTLDEVRGKNPRILKSGLTPPEVYQELWRTILSGGEWRGEFANRKKNGELYWESVSISPITNDHGLITHFVAVKEDITDRKKAEQALREAHEYAAWMARFPEENPNPVARVTATGTILYRNRPAATLPGWLLETGQPLPATLMALVQRALETGHEVREDVLLGDRYYSVSAMPFLDEHYANLYGRDVTERKQAEEAVQETARQLARSNQELEQFAFIASHDLQEPLRKIIIFSQRLLGMLGESCPKEAVEYLTRMQRAAERMQTMVNGLLDLSRVNTRGSTFGPVPLRRAVEEALSDLETRLQATGGEVILSDLPTIYADPMQIRQLFQNLIGNALKFHRPGVPPVVRVSAQEMLDGDLRRVAIQVADNGTGFDEQYAGRIFQPFQRLHARSEYDGTGLGLAICQKIVERHHGAIEVHSRPGEGSTFTVKLPIRAGG